MNHNIIVDSCCDLTAEIKERLNISTVPLYLNLGQTQIVDENVNIDQFLNEMKQCQDKIGSAAPSPHSYQKLMEKHESSFVVTLSSRLSSSYSSAQIAHDMVDQTKHDVHIFDSKSAASGQLLIVLKLEQYCREGLSKVDIIKKMKTYIDNMKTYFVLDNIDNLLKNGRLGKVKASFIQILNIKLLMGSDGDGQIVHFKNCRGKSKIVPKLIEMIHESGRETDGEIAVISHVKNETVALKLKAEMEKQFKFKEIVVAPTGGVSSLYANDQGIIISF